MSSVWNLSHSYVTYTLQQGGTDGNGTTWVQKNWADLEPGDAVNYEGSPPAGHVMLFTGWLDAAKTQYCVLAESYPGATDPWGGLGCIAHSTDVAGDIAGGFVPIGLTALPDSVTDTVILPLAATYDDSRSSDIDGDGISDLCARHSGGFDCVRSSQDGFAEPVPGVGLSNDQGWSFPEYYGTLRMGDLDGDSKADLCARGGAGVGGWLSDGSSFTVPVPAPTGATRTAGPTSGTGARSDSPTSTATEGMTSAGAAATASGIISRPAPASAI